MRQRKLLLPPFHGEAVQRYTEMIAEAADREIDRWPTGRPFALAPRMQAITLDVIMAGIFGIEGAPAKGTPEHGLRTAISRVVDASTRPGSQLAELVNLGSDEAVGPTRLFVSYLDRHLFAAIGARREAGARGRARTSCRYCSTPRPRTASASPTRSCATSCSRSCSRATRRPPTRSRGRSSGCCATPAAYERLRDVARSDEDPDGYLEATIHEAMRARPVIPIIGRRVTRRWQLGRVHASRRAAAVLMSILLLHHRDDVYPDPFAFRPERFVGRKPGTYTWIPFGGGIRRCLGRGARDGRAARGARGRSPAAPTSRRPTRARSARVTAT